MLPSVPPALQSYIDIEDDGEQLHIMCRAPRVKDERIFREYLDQCILTEFPPSPTKVAEGRSDEADLLLHEAISNMYAHTYPEAREDTLLYIDINRKTGAFDLRMIGFVTDVDQYRMGKKFEVAESLTKEQAKERLRKFEQSEEVGDGIESVSGHETAGVGLLSMRASADGPMHLTFYPDRKITREADLSLHQFELEIMARVGNRAIVSGLEHDGTIHSFYPRIVHER